MNFSDAERQSSYRLTMLIGLNGFAFLLVFGANALHQERTGLGATLLACASLGAALLLLMHNTGDPRFGVSGLTVTTVFLFGFVLVTGGTDLSGPLWCYPLVVIIMFLQGFRRGAILLGGLLVFLLVVLFLPGLPFETAVYSPTFKLRFVASLCALVIMALIYEHLRQQAQENFREISSQLVHASRTDDLTGLANRRAMRQLLEAEHARYLRHGVVYALVMVDLDHFKRVNDRFGHAAGDDVLAATSQCLHRGVRTEDRVGRWGGEEFLILLPATGRAQAALVAEKLREAVAEIDFTASGLNARLTASFGVQSSDGATDLDDLISQVDRAMYSAKRVGRNRVVLGAAPEAEAEAAHPQA